VTTGVSSHDRTVTIRHLADPDGERRLHAPGHVQPLRARPGGVLKRAGHTEAIVDLCRRRREPCGVLCEILREDGVVARRADLDGFARLHGLRMVTIEDLIRHRRLNETLVVRRAETRLPTRWASGGASATRTSSTTTPTWPWLSARSPRRTLSRSSARAQRVPDGDVFGSQRCD